MIWMRLWVAVTKLGSDRRRMLQCKWLVVLWFVFWEYLALQYTNEFLVIEKCCKVFYFFSEKSSSPIDQREFYVRQDAWQSIRNMDRSGGLFCKRKAGSMSAYETDGLDGILRLPESQMDGENEALCVVSCMFVMSKPMALDLGML